MTDVPSWDRFMVPVLEVLSDGSTVQIRDLRVSVARHVGLTPEAMQVRLPAGDLMAENRIGWAASYLTRVNALERPSRGHYQITPLGRQLLSKHPEGISEHELRAYAIDGDDWWSASAPRKAIISAPVAAAEMELDPVEQIEVGVARIEADVTDQLLKRLHAQPPGFFEGAVLRLLMAMGYGGSDGTATQTPLSNDGGIDGVIDQDALGLSRVHVQAKRYARNTAVSRPEIQGFIGAMAGSQANQGVFITTGRFSGAAREYAATVPTRVVLIDGPRMAALMIRFGVGVQVKRAVNIVEVDEDFFE